MSHKHRAAIIGVSDYLPGMPSLPAVAQDVREVAKLLGSDKGNFRNGEINLLLNLDATRDAILNALSNVLGKALPEDTVFVYFAGHGYLDIDGSYYFIPHDAKLTDIRSTAIPLTAIKQIFDGSPSEKVLLWLDFCHAGGILARGLPQPGEAQALASITRALHVVQGRGKVIMCACTADQQAYEDADHGHFTKYLLEGLRGAATNTVGEVTASSLYDYIDHAMGSARQRPMLFGTMTGRIVLMQTRDIKSGTGVAQAAEPGFVVNDSGNWVMLDRTFFETSSVRQSARGEIHVQIPSTGAEDDALIDRLKPERFRTSDPIRYAYRNDGLLVRVKNVESESTPQAFAWTVTLEPEAIHYGGELMSDIGLQQNGRRYGADEIAELRARRLLLNDPVPSVGEGGYSSGGNNMLEIFVEGLNTNYPVKECIFRRLYPELRDNPQRFLELSRLAAIFALKASQVFEHVLELTLGPLVNGKLHVRCRGRRRAIYSNVKATEFNIEGDCPLD